jgi:hypothetical protein
MANKPEQVPETVIAAGVTEHFRQQERCEAEHRGDRIGGGDVPSMIGDENWYQHYHDREEFDRQYGALQGKSTYERGTVFAAGHGKGKSEPGRE